MKSLRKCNNYILNQLAWIYYTNNKFVYFPGTTLLSPHFMDLNNALNIHFFSFFFRKRLVLRRYNLKKHQTTVLPIFV